MVWVVTMTMICGGKAASERRGVRDPISGVFRNIP
jgi:hypothetical protein